MAWKSTSLSTLLKVKKYKIFDFHQFRRLKDHSLNYRRRNNALAEADKLSTVSKLRRRVLIGGILAPLSPLNMFGTNSKE